MENFSFGSFLLRALFALLLVLLTFNYKRWSGQAMVDEVNDVK